MALTISAVPGPSWDETIVPALRKRLESESRTLSKRLSATGIAPLSAEQAPSPLMDTQPTHVRASNPSYAFHPSKSTTAIPRPSLQQSRASSDIRPEPNGSSRANDTAHSRTYSQPKAFDPPYLRNGAQPNPSHPNGSSVPLPTPESSRSTSPQYTPRVTDTKPTRIPKAAGVARTSSSSSRSPHQPSTINTVVNDSRHGNPPYTPPTPESTLDTWKADENLNAAQPYMRSSYAAASSLTHSRLLHEPAPFHGSASSIDHSFDHSQDDTQPPGRRSNESEERPFEHWYRGEVSRNGGVGELRVGKRVEMLEIANYGHTLRKASPRTLTNSRVFPSAPDDTPRSRKRAGSVSRIEERDSLYLDEERAEAVGRVLDEGPPTDLDPDDLSDHSMSVQLYRHHQLHQDPMPSSPLTSSHDMDGDDSIATAGDSTGNVTRTTNHSPSPPPASVQPSRIPAPVGPTPSRQSSEPPRTRTPTLTQRGASEPPSFASSSSTSAPPPTSSSVPRSASQPGQTQKRRGKSPGASMQASKRSKATAKTIADKKAANKDHRGSIAHYPAPADGVDMVDAIPSWTEPVLASGNWDEVVLPVVARKRGLDGLYERVGGGSAIRKPTAVPPAPAPGTFGYDHSKYRPGDLIAMDEFGRNPEVVAETTTKSQRPQSPRKTDIPPRIPEPPTSPTPDARPDTRRPTVSNAENGRLQRDAEMMDEEESGCCKCVIM